jgi:hypothetical protein
VTYNVQSNAILVVTGIAAGRNNNQLAGSGIFSAGQADFDNNFECLNGICPIISFTDCQVGNPNSVCAWNNNGSNLCNPAVQGFISASQSTCGTSIDPAPLSVIGNTDFILRWEKSTDGGATWQGINHIGNTYDPPVVTVTTMFRVITINISGSSFCNAYTEPAVINVGVPANAGLIGGPANVCANTTGMIYSVPPINGATSYIWSYSGTGVTINGTGRVVSLDFAVGATSGNLTVRGQNSCGMGGISANFAINVSNAAPPVLNQPANVEVCEGLATGTVTFTGTNLTGVDWINSNTSIGLAAFGSDNSAPYTIGSFTAINLGANTIFANVIVTPKNASCQGASKSFQYIINPKPMPAEIIIGPTNVCKAEYVYSTLPIPGSTQYIWTTHSSILINGAAPPCTTSSLSVLIDFSGSSGNRTINVRGFNSCGAGAAMATALSVTISNTASIPTMDQPADQTVCAGAATAAVTFTGTNVTTYSWTNTNNSIGLGTNGTGNIASFTSINNTNTDQFGVVTVTPSNASCSGPQKVFTYTIKPILAPSVSISASPGSTICSGQSVTFTATPVNAGPTPSYQWKLNGNNVGSNSATYTNNALANGDQVQVVLTANNCSPGANSNSITMTVNPSVTPTISIAITSDNPCSNLNFTSSITNGGLSPQYQWRKNGVDILGATNATYSGTGAGLVDGDEITCVLTSSVACPTSNPITSNTFTVSSAIPTTTFNSGTNWTVGVNWSTGSVPTRNFSVVIPTGQNVQLNGVGECFNLTIQPGASLTINGSNQLLIYGNLINDGTLTTNSSEIIFADCPGIVTSNPHTISSNNGSTIDFNNLTLNDNSGATLNTNATIRGALNLQNGTFSNPASSFTFLSDANATARIAPVNVAADYDGDITMQRFAPGGLTGWALLGTPIQGATIAQWANDFQLQDSRVPLDGLEVSFQCTIMTKYRVAHLMMLILMFQ